MGNHPSALADDGQSPIHRQSYTVRGPLYARSITASTVNAGTVRARHVTCQSAQISSRLPLDPQDYPDPPHRAITAHTVNADAIYADEINCKTLRCYDACVGSGQQWNAKRTKWLDRGQAVWDGKEDADSESSDSESDEEHTKNADRATRKNMAKMGLAGAAAIGIGGAAFAYLKHKMDGKEGNEEKTEREKKDELRRRHDGQVRHGGEHDDGQRRDDVGRRERGQRDQHQQDEHARHSQAPAVSPSVRGDYHLSSRQAHLWSDGNHCFLVADCDCGDGRFQESRIDLDEIISDADGEFHWVRRGQAGNFSGTAQRWEILEQGSFMAADLQGIDGSWHRKRFDLAEFIKNDNGHLKYTKQGHSVV